MDNFQGHSLDHDFNNNWGTILGVAQTEERPLANSLWADYARNPAQVERRYDELLLLYTNRFEVFFRGLLPISFHAHVTDAINPTTIGSMLLRLAIFSKSDAPDSIPISTPQDRPAAVSLLDWHDMHLRGPRWALPADSYAAAYGPLADLSGQPAFQDIACGPEPVLLRLENVSRNDLSEQLDTAKQNGCVGVLVEIVTNQNNGKVIGVRELENLSRLCAEKGLVFAVDETITSIRCGAPFAYQRAEYSDVLSPDLVFFGKGLAANGTAINFNGSFMKRFQITEDVHKRQAIQNWQSVVTLPIQLPILIQALGVLEMAAASNWVERSKLVGGLIREIVISRARDEVNTASSHGILGGLDCFIFVRIDIAAQFLVMGASNAGPWVPWVRWLPRLEDHMTLRSTLEEILGGLSRPTREQLSRTLIAEGLKPPWCFWCGNKAINTKYEWCRQCCIDICDTDACTKGLMSHKCLL